MPWTPSGPLVLGSEMPGSGITIGGVLEGVVASLFEPSASKIKDRPPPWFTGYSKEFMKASGKMDGKMQSRIFRAVMKISKDPEKVRGDTQKPLATSKVCGDTESETIGWFICQLEYGNIVFVDFASRGRSLWLAILLPGWSTLRVSRFDSPYGRILSFFRSGRSSLFLQKAFHDLLDGIDHEVNTWLVVVNFLPPSYA